MKEIKPCNMLFMLVFLFCLSLASVASAEVILTDDEAQMFGHELMIAKTSIQNSKEQIRQLNLKLKKALSDLDLQKQSLTVQQVQLNAANKSLELQNKELKKEIHKVVRERNIAYTITAVCLVRALSKK